LTVLWQKTLKPIDHQIIWWMVDLGVPGNILVHGWQGQAAGQLGIHRITLGYRVRALVKAGVLVSVNKKGSVRFNLSVFEKVASRSGIRLEPA